VREADMRYERNSRKLIKLLEQDDWFLADVNGDHHQFKHPIKKGRVTVPHPDKDIPIGTVRSIYRQAGWLKG
jgi:predicted RNA binding protein YcfA (HicA-like mRNA interferase family)